MHNQLLSKAAWLYLPLISFALCLMLEFSLPPQYYGYFVNENGILETAQPVIIALGAVLAFLNLRKYNIKNSPMLFGWFALALLGCIYIAGEEISWGQQIFKWETPQGWLEINDQQETNLHNTSSWLDQKPRLIIEIGVIFGGLILPLIRKFKSEIIPTWSLPILPPVSLWVCASCFLIAKLSDKVGDFFDVHMFRRASEVTELYMLLFITLYLFAKLKECSAEE